MKSDLLKFGKELRPIKLKNFPDEELFARPVTIAERIAFNETRLTDKDFGQHEMIYLSTFTKDGRYYFESPQEVAQLAAPIADELLIKILRASGVSAAAGDEAEKKSDGSVN